MRKRTIWAGLMLALLGASGAGASGDGPGVSADDALKKLLDGNGRYTSGKMANPGRDAKRRGAIATAQHPFAIVLGCSDSRVPPEVLFDQGLGDLFVIRTAGNVADDVALGSIEYAAEHLHVPLLVVLGHECCGAVGATAAGGEAPGHIDAIVKAIQPAVEKVKGKEGDLVDNAVAANVQNVTAQLKASQPLLAKLVEEGTLKIVGARYDLDSGVVDLIP
ncbi:MAG: carbonic anhydrase [Deltaproteobacteria bacterium]|nr:carbonic anhydrase [Deltaproteobacteria bacterium]